MDNLDEREFQTLLTDIFDVASDSYELGDELSRCQVESFEEAGLLTTDHGIVVTLSNGQRFALTIQQY